MLDITILSRDAERYEALLREWSQRQTTVGDTHQINLLVATDDPQRIEPEKVHVLLSEPDLAIQVVSDCHRLAWLQSTWAGNAPLINCAKRDYLLTAARGIFGPAMREYVFAYLLHFARNVAAFETNTWQRPAFTSLNGKVLAILGAGDIASSLLPVAKAFGMHTRALTRSGTSENRYDAVYCPEQYAAFAHNADFVISLLPDTPETANFIGTSFIQALPEHCVLINAGRGHSIDDEALVSALQNKRIKAAVLDVFRQEPLPENSPYWHLPNAIVTCHTAAISSPEDVFDVFINNCLRWQRGEALKYPIDFVRGY